MSDSTSEKKKKKKTFAGFPTVIGGNSRGGGILVRALASGLSGQGSSPDCNHCFVLLGNLDT